MPRPDKSEHDFGLTLVEAVAKIRKEARGRTCGTCVYFGHDHCDRDDLEWTVVIIDPDAVACSRYKEKRDAL